mgnify:FL=1
MQYMVIIIISIITLIVLKFAFGIKIKNINEIKKIGNDKKFNNIASKLPNNKIICETILKMVDNDSIKIDVVEDQNKSLTYYSVISNSIIITNIKDTFTRVQTIAHECLHSIQNRRLLLFNFIFSNIYLIYFVVVCILSILKIIELSTLQIFIAFLMGMIFYFVRSYLETDAMTKAKYLAEMYMKGSNIISDDEIKVLVDGYEKLNKIGIPMTNFLLFCKVIIKVIILSIIGVIT